MKKEDWNKITFEWIQKNLYNFHDLICFEIQEEVNEALKENGIKHLQTIVEKEYSEVADEVVVTHVYKHVMEHGGKTYCVDITHSSWDGDAEFYECEVTVEVIHKTVVKRKE